MPDNTWCRGFNDRTELNRIQRESEAAQRAQYRRSMCNIARRRNIAALRHHVRLVALDASLITACVMALAAMIAYVT